jgi:hypothetical protein
MVLAAVLLNIRLRVHRLVLLILVVVIIVVAPCELRKRHLAQPSAERLCEGREK